MPRERTDHDKRQRGKRRAPDQLENPLPSPHDVKESRASHEGKQKECFGGYLADKIVDWLFRERHDFLAD
jgi:hypothetical protein